MAQAAEEVGFDSIWLGDHLLYRGDGREERGPWEAWTLLAALAAVTERVRLGPLVACASFHPPGLIAKMAATVDEISGGRFVLGLGAGSVEIEHTIFGLPVERRVSRFAESFEIVRRLLAGERVTFDGRYWSADDAVLLPEPARRVPLMAGSIGPRMLGDHAPARRLVEHVVPWYGNTAEGLRGAEYEDRRRRAVAGGARAGEHRPQRVRARGARLRRGQAAARRRDGRRSPPASCPTCFATSKRPAPTRRSSSSGRSPRRRSASSATSSHRPHPERHGRFVERRPTILAPERLWRLASSPSSSPTSSTRPRCSHRSATRREEWSCAPTCACSAMRSLRTTAGRSRRSATGSWRPSTVRQMPSPVPWRCSGPSISTTGATACRSRCASASRSVRRSRARSSSRTTSAAP